MLGRIDIRSALNLLLIFVPLPILGQWLGLPASFIFFSACLGIIPLASLMGKATEHLSERLGEGAGALLTATFGNACELIIGFAALQAGLIQVVKASIIGSIMGNILLVLGGSMLSGGMRRQGQNFNRVAASTQATLLVLSAISLCVPAVFHGASGHHVNEHRLALAIAAVLVIIYLLSLLFSLKTHKHLYARALDREADLAIGTEGWGAGKAAAVLFISTLVVVVLSEYLVQAVEGTARALGMTQLFIGVILVAVVGNAAEHSTAVLMAIKDKMDLSIHIALGAASQIALFVAPVLVFAGYLIGQPMDLSFTLPEVLAVAVSVIILSFVILDGECNWLEGAQLLAVYVILAIAFYFA